ncbi:MAG: preprotein translocase subunit YajC [Oscillospiraceae bacterium]|nr:preprotein translocase subunit YajC [Oscillospiraceae bacterium]
MNPSLIFMFVALAAMTYFTTVRPDNKKKKEQAKMHDALSVGDTITTVGGMIGKIVRIDSEKLTFETSEDRVRIQIVRSAVSSVGRPSDDN